MDAAGCYRQEIVVVGKTIEKILYFDFDSSAVKDTHKAEAKEIAAFLKDGVNSSIELGGHADSIGSSDYNIALSLNRAEAIAQLLTQTTGIEAAISILAFGENMPKVKGRGRRCSS